MGGVVSSIGSALGGVVGLVGDVVGAITGADQTNALKDAAKAQSQAQEAALAAQKRQAQLDEQETNAARQNSPEYVEDGFYDSYDTSSYLTGTGGLSPDDYTLGRNSLLSGGNNSSSS